MKAASPVLPSNPQFAEVVFAKNQPEYLQLPACPIQYPDGTKSVITRYELTVAELAEITRTGRIWLEQITFGQPLQPQRLTVFEPLTPADAPLPVERLVIPPAS